MRRILDRFEVGPAMLADRLGCRPARVERLLAEPRRAPLVMLDAEDALALTDEAVEQARTDAADVLLTRTGAAEARARSASTARRASPWVRRPVSCTGCCGG